MKVARKMTVALVLGIFAVLALHSYGRVRRETGLFESDMRRDGHTMGRVLGAAVVEVWRTDGQEHARRLIAEVNESESNVTIRLVSLDGAAEGEAGPLLGREVMGRVALGEEVVGKARDVDGSEQLVTYAPVLVGDRRVGAVELAESMRGERDYIRTTLVNVLMAIGALALVCGAMTIGLGVWFVGRPMRSLIEQARRVGAGDLSRRLSLAQRDEIGELAGEMNAMCDRLVEANERASGEMSRRIETMEQLRHADRLATVGRLASGIAHELGAPLQVVSGRAKMIADGDVAGEEIEINARIIHDQVVRMASIIRQLLDFARRRAADKAPADLAELMRKTCLLLSPLADKNRVALTIESARSESARSEGARSEGAPAGGGEGDGGAARGGVGKGDAARGVAESGDGDGMGRGFVVKVDAEQIQQALTNLVVNAIQAMPRGGALSLRLRREVAEPPASSGAGGRACLRLDVQDQGDGMTRETIEHVFEPFFTTKPPGEGTGLGLAVAEGIVREHGGWIRVQSTPGSGSLFSMFVPEDGET